MSVKSLRSLCAMAGALFLVSVTVSPALAQDEGGSLAASYEAGTLADQLSLDVTPVPVGMGALFVPTLTDSDLEPKVIVFHDGQRVASGSTGKRIVLPPGTYEVVFGRGPVERRARAQVTVVDGATFPVASFYGAVRVDAVGRDGKPVSRDYTITRLRDGDRASVGRTSEEASYASTPTWVLTPGNYTLSLGSGGEDDPNAFSFVVHPGEVLRYRLVVEEGRLTRVDFADREVVVKEDIFKVQWVAGGSLGLEQTQRQLSTFNGESMRVGVFTNASFALDTGPHLAKLSVSIDESWLALESGFGRGLPLQKLNDELRAELLYNFRLGGIVGPYVRAAGRTSLFDTDFFPSSDFILETTDASGDVETENVQANDDVKLMSGFYPLYIQEGAGLGVTLLDNEVVSTGVRVGVAALQAYYDGGRVITGRRGNTIELVELSDKQGFGAEATAYLSLRLGSAFSYNTTFNAYVPQGQILSGDDFLPLYRWDNTAALRLGSFAYLVYDASLHRDDVQIEDMQLRQNLSVRLQHTLF